MNTGLPMWQLVLAVTASFVWLIVPALLIYLIALAKERGLPAWREYRRRRARARLFFLRDQARLTLRIEGQRGE